MIDRKSILALLPKFEDKWVTIEEDQGTGDIIQDILDKHNKFAGYYDKFALCFDSKSIKQICDSLFDFCKKNIKYNEESVDNQTTSLPTGILIRGEGDCKHYASFIGGVLDGINRNTRKSIDWCYRFASYEMLDDVPHHVYIVVNDKGEEIWIDPTPGAENKFPCFIQDRYIKSDNMPLRSNIGTVNRNYGGISKINTDSLVSAGLGIVTTIFTGLLKNIGDKVPDYPIRDQDTLTKIVNAIYTRYPQDDSNLTIDQAQALLTQSLSDQKGANEEAARKQAAGKNPAPDQTYAIIYGKIAKGLQDYIASQGYTPQTATASATYPGGPISPLPKSDTTNSNTGLLVVGGIAALLFLMPKKKAVSGTGSTGLLIAGSLVGLYFLTKGGGNGQTDPQIAAMRQSVSNWTDDEYFIAVVQRMTDDEINTAYDFIFNYLLKAKPVTPGSTLQNKLIALSNKYQIFT